MCVCVCVCVCVRVQTALELLDYHYSDEKVRSMAVKRLQGLEDDELVEILLQLVQVRGGVEGREGGREGRKGEGVEGRKGGGWRGGEEGRRRGG